MLMIMIPTVIIVHFGLLWLVSVYSGLELKVGLKSLIVMVILCELAGAVVGILLFLGIGHHIAMILFAGVLVTIFMLNLVFYDYFDVKSKLIRVSVLFFSFLIIYCSGYISLWSIKYLSPA